MYIQYIMLMYAHTHTQYTNKHIDADIDKITLDRAN